MNMDKNAIKAIVQNYQWSTMDDIEEVLQFIADSKMNELGADIVFETQYEEGGQVSSERTADGKQQVGIGILPLSTIKTDKELGLETNPLEERKKFIEVILQTFHELRYVKQNHNMIDNPIVTADTLGMTREQIINDSFPEFRSRFNYESSMIEIDAMRTSLIEAVQFFQDMETDITPDEVFQVMKEKEFFELIDQYGIDLVELGIKIGELCGWEGAHGVYEKEGQWIYYSAEQLNKTTYFEVLGAFNYLIYLRNKPQEALANLQKCLPRR